jgi:hypothetical protein
VITREVVISEKTQSNLDPGVVGEVLDDLEVALHVLDHARPTHLHDHFGSVV